MIKGLTRSLLKTSQFRGSHSSAASYDWRDDPKLNTLLTPLFEFDKKENRDRR